MTREEAAVEYLRVKADFDAQMAREEQARRDSENARKRLYESKMALAKAAGYKPNDQPVSVICGTQLIRLSTRREDRCRSHKDGPPDIEANVEGFLG